MTNTPNGPNPMRPFPGDKVTDTKKVWTTNTNPLATVREALTAFEDILALAGFGADDVDLVRDAQAALNSIDNPWLAWSDGRYPDDSPGDVISAEFDGTIILDDGITTWNPLRALAFYHQQIEQLTKALRLAIGDMLEAEAKPRTGFGADMAVDSYFARAQIEEVK